MNSIASTLNTSAGHGQISSGPNTSGHSLPPLVYLVIGLVAGIIMTIVILVGIMIVLKKRRAIPGRISNQVYGQSKHCIILILMTLINMVCSIIDRVLLHRIHHQRSKS